MRLYTINTGYFKLDGGAMFGVVPKSLWNKSNPADENNMCTWAMRCLLVEDGSRLILIDSGIGNKQDEKFFSRYYLHGDDTVENSLKDAGFSVNDITTVFLTHLHFDHCGGSVCWNKGKTGFELAFPNATYLSNKDHWNWAKNANKRELASFLKENILPIEESKQLEFIDDKTEITPGFNLMYANGHTVAMMLPKIKINNKTIVYMADLLPSIAHISIPYVMAYDTFPNVTMEEKERFLNEAADNDYILFFEHDPTNECCTIERTEKGFKVKDKFKLNEVL